MTCGTIKQLNPILTIKLKNVITTGDVGKNVTIKIKVDLPHAKEEDRGINAEDVWLYQRPVDRNISNVDFEIEVIEKDKQIPDTSGKKKFILPIGATKLPCKGPRKKEGYVLLVKGDDGPYGFRKATFTVYLKWWLTDNANDFCKYIKEEIENNKVSDAAKLIMGLDKEKSTTALADGFKFLANNLINKPGLIKHMERKLDILALARFANMVWPGHDWDHKVEICAKMAENKCGIYSLDAEMDRYYHYDLWSNFHFGYIGRVLGFSGDILKKGAAIAQAGSDLRGKIDKVIPEIDCILKDIYDKSYGKAILKMFDMSEIACEALEKLEHIMEVKKIEDLDNEGDQAMIQAGIDCYETVQKGTAGLSEVAILAAVRARYKEYKKIDSKYLVDDEGKSITEGLPWKGYLVTNNQF